MISKSDKNFVNKKYVQNWWLLLKRSWLPAMILQDLEYKLIKTPTMENNNQHVLKKITSFSDRK